MARKPRAGRAFDIRNFRARVDQDLADELEFHFEATIEDLVRSGFSPEEAEAEALRRFGDRDRHLENLRVAYRGAVRRRVWRERTIDLVRGIALVLRGLRRSPGFTIAAVATLALGIGANATMFGIVDRLLLRAPDHVDRPDDVGRVFVQREARPGTIFTGATHTYPDIRDWDAAATLAGLATYQNWGELTLGRGPGARRVAATVADARLFPVLGARPALGRFYSEVEDRRGGPPVAVLGHELWTTAFGADREVLGRVIELDGRSLTVIGIAPPGFTGAELRRTDVWLPLLSVGVEISETNLESRGDWWLRAIVRLTAGATRETAAAELTTLHRAGRAQDTQSYDPEARVIIAPLIAARGPDGSTEASVSLWLSGVALVVLLIACANVANLFLARGTRRARENAVRLSLGAPTSRLLGGVLMESAVIAALAAVAATLLSMFAGDLARRVLLPGIHWTGSGIDGRVGLVTVAVALAAGMLAGVAPAWHSVRTEVAGVLRGADGRSTTRRSLLLNTLLVVQPALSVVLLVGAGLFVRSLSEVRGIDLGFEPESLYLVSVESDTRTSELLERAIPRLEGLPVVERAAAAFGTPFRNSWSERFGVPDRDSLPDLEGGGPYLNAVTEGFLPTLGIEIVAGRGIESGDGAGQPRVAVLGRYLAERLWPGESPLGRCVTVGATDACTTVVGVAEDAHRQSLIEGPEALYYVPLAQHRAELPARALFVRASDEAVDLRATLRSELEGLDAGVRYAAVVPYRDLIDPQARAWTLGATLFSAFGLLAVLVAALGIYSVLAFDVSRRVSEIGIRGALGASGARIAGLVLRDVGFVACVGLALGVGAALLAAPLVEPLLHGVSARDPVVLATVVLALVTVTVCAGLVPAWRATRVDPNVALRAE